MSQPPLPNFFIVGTGKAGTTSLYRYLRQHPQIYMSPVKEPCYFADEVRPETLNNRTRNHVALQSRKLATVLQDGQPVKPHGWLAADWEDYLRLFAGVRRETAIGEASAAYLWSPTAAANIHARLPTAKIIMILRDPAERAFSQYLHQLSVGLTGATFRQHLEACARAGTRELSALYPFLEIGLYHQQVSRFLECFPSDQIRIYRYEEIWPRSSQFLTEVYQFLGVDPTFQPDLSRRDHQRRAPRAVALHYFLKSSGLWYPLKALVPAASRSWLRHRAFRRGKSLAMLPEDRLYLIDYYRADIQNLSTLLSRDLSSWLDPTPAPPN